MEFNRREETRKVARLPTEEMSTYKNTEALMRFASVLRLHPRPGCVTREKPRLKLQVHDDKRGETGDRA